MTPFVFFDNRDSLPGWFIRILKTLPDSCDVYVLTNAPKPNSLRRRSKINFIPLSSLIYYDRFNEFRSIYVHLSTHEEEFELSCFERYFALLAFMESSHHLSVWHLDTDILPTVALNYFSDLSLVFSSPYYNGSVVSAHTSKFTLEAIRDFTNFLLFTFYAENFSDLKEFYEDRLSKNLLGGVCDMQALALWLKQLPANQWFNSYGQEHQGFRINHTISGISEELSNNGRSSSNILLLSLGRGQVRVSDNLETYRYASLHFQGQYKYLILYFLKLRILIGSANSIHFLTRVATKTHFLRRSLIKAT